MSAPNHTTYHRLTPRNKFLSPLTPGFDNCDNLRLSLNRVIGTTILAANAIDCVQDRGIIATCCGQAAVVSHVDEHLNVTQRIFRAAPNSVAPNTSPSFYHPGTPPAIRDLAARQSILRDAGSGISLSGHTDVVVDSPGRVKANTRTRSASCLSVSRDGKLLAVGENGVHPRISIFSLADDAPLDTPLTTLNEHSNFGVRSVAFSADSRWLCSLGNINDGFIFLWSISKNGSARLHASNKCVSSVQEIAWMGTSVISVGIRHVKVWRLDPEPASPTKGRPELIKGYDIPSASPVPKAFSGRNCILGSLIDAVFTSVIAISESKAILCTEHCICLLDDVDQSQRLEKVAHVDFRVRCVSVGASQDSVIVAGSEGRVKILLMQDLERSEVILDPADLSSRSSHTPGDIGFRRTFPSILAVGYLCKERIFTVDSAHTLCIKSVEKAEDEDPTTCLKQIAAHDSAVLGVSVLQQPNRQAADFFTWSSQGTALFWTLDGTCTHRLQVSLGQESISEFGDANELKVLRASPTDSLFVFGDKYGNVGIPVPSGQTIKAHIGDVNDLAVVQVERGLTLVASCGRDRVLQLFQLQDGALRLLQTMENEHAASINNLWFLNNGSTLVSSSADRTVVIRTLALVQGQDAAYIPTKILTLKSSPVALTHKPDESKQLIVSTMDRQILTFDIDTGHLIQSFKATDFQGRDAVVIGSMISQNVDTEASKAPVIFGVSSNDRSIRAYDSGKGILLAIEYGQLAISDIAVLEATDQRRFDSPIIITTGLDSTIMIWTLSAAPIPQQAIDGGRGSQDILSDRSRSSKPLRRVLSKSALSDLQKSLDREPTTPTRSQNLSRLRKKPSRPTLGSTSKQASLKLSKSARHSPSSSAHDVGPNALRDPSPTFTTQKVALASRTKRASSDAATNHHSTSRSPDDIAPTAEILCRYLHAFRSRLETSTEKLEPDMGQRLERELVETMQVVRQQTQETQHMSSEASTANPIDGWLARLIDERLALRLGDTIDEKD